jgi:hypothetical protein
MPLRGPFGRRGSRLVMERKMSTADLADQVQRALVAHGAWKVRLAQAIETGSSEFLPSAVSKDDQCALGKWLYVDIDPVLKSDPYDTIRKLHADFHLAAAGVLDMALAGRKAEAQAAMDTGHDFGRASTRLTLALTAWRSSVGS